MELNCEFVHNTRKAAFGLPEGVAMAHNSYTMSTRGLPDMYTLSPRASGVHIRQTTCVHGIIIKCIIVMFDGVNVWLMAELKIVWQKVW